MLNPEELAPGNEQYEKFRSSIDFKRKQFYQYDYRHTNGELFSCVEDSLDKCRDRRDKWLENLATPTRNMVK